MIIVARSVRFNVKIDSCGPNPFFTTGYFSGKHLLSPIAKKGKRLGEMVQVAVLRGDGPPMNETSPLSLEEREPFFTSINLYVWNKSLFAWNKFLRN